MLPLGMDRTRARRRAGASVVLAGVVLVLFGASFAMASHDTGILHVCEGSSGKIRVGQPCQSNETAHNLVTEAALAALRADLAATSTDLDGRLDDLEAADGDIDARLDALEAADEDLDARLDDLEDRIAALELAVSEATVTFNKIYDGGHYASYQVSGTGFLPDSTVTSGVGTTATVSDDGTFAVFGGNLFCDDQVSISGTDANGNPVSRSAEVECNSESPYVSPAEVTFNKIYDGGHYASYQVAGSHFQPGSTVTSGVGTTATVAGDGTFSVFGGNLFCDDEVTVSGTDENGTFVSRSAPVVCNNE